MMVFASLVASAVFGSIPDYSQSKIHSGTIGGLINGSAFRVQTVELAELGFDTVKESGRIVDRARKYHLSFENEDMRVLVIFTLDPRTSLAGSKLATPPLKFGTEEYRRHYYPGARGGVARGVIGVHVHGLENKVDLHNDGFSGRIEFDVPRADSIAGRIILVVPDASKSYLTGRFTAKLTRF